MPDRLKELQENMKKYNDTMDIFTANHFAVIDMETPFTTDFFDEVHELRDSIDTIIQLIDDVEHLQQALLAPQAIIGTKEKLEEKMNDIKLLGHDIRVNIKRIKSEQEIYNPSRVKNARQRIVDEQMDVITKHFCAIMDKYYQSVMIHREKCIQRIQRQNELMNITKTDDEIEEILENKRLTMFPDIIIETRQAQQSLDLMKLRHQELIKLEDGLQEVHDMFFDVASLIKSQGDQITTIADRVAFAADYVFDSKQIIGARKVSTRFHLKV